MTGINDAGPCLKLESFKVLYSVMSNSHNILLTNIKKFNALAKQPGTRTYIGFTSFFPWSCYNFQLLFLFNISEIKLVHNFY